MGLTGQELSKLVESGQLMSTDFLPKFLNQMQSFVHGNGMLEASLKKVAAEQGRFNMRLVEAIDIGYQSGRSGFFGFYYNLRKIIEDNTQTFEVFGAVFGGTMKFVSHIIKTTVSPAVSVLSASLNVLRKGFQNALDSSNTWDNLTALEAVFRGAAWAAMYLDLGLLYIRKHLTDLAKWLGATDEGASSFSKQLLAVGTAIVTIAVGLKAFYAVFRWAFLKPLGLAYELAKKLFGLFGVGLPTIGDKGGRGKSAAGEVGGKSLGRGATEVAKRGLLGRLLGPAGWFLSGAGMMAGKAWNDLSNNNIVGALRNSAPDPSRITDVEARMLAGNKSIIMNNNITVTGDDPVVIGREVARQLQQQHILALEAE